MTYHSAHGTFDPHVKSWEQIIEAIKRTAADNDGVPAGLARGERDIGILITAPLGR